MTQKPADPARKSGPAAADPSVSPPHSPPMSPPAPAIVLRQPPGEVDGPKGLEPTRYGDWERKGIASDF